MSVHIRALSTTHPEVALKSTSGHDKRRLQNANGGLSGGVRCTGDVRCRNEPGLGGMRLAASAEPRDDCRLIELVCAVEVPGGGTTFGKPKK